MVVYFLSAVLLVLKREFVEYINAKLGPELGQVVPGSQLLCLKQFLVAATQTGHPDQPVGCNYESQAEEVAHDDILKLLLAWLATLCLYPTVMSGHQECLRRNVVRRETIGKSAPFDKFVLAVDQTRAVHIEYDESVQEVTLQFSYTLAYFSFD